MLSFFLVLLSGLKSKEQDPTEIAPAEFKTTEKNKYQTPLNKTSEEKKCPYKNTRLHGSKCYCISGYFGDKPIGPRGCWTCEPKCLFDAQCTYPGRCVCKYGLVGDGVTNCDPPVPSIISLTQIPFSSYVITYYQAPTEFIPYVAYCNFNKQIVNGLININRSISCLIPKDLSGEVLISLSFDMSNWSNSIPFIINEVTYNKTNFQKRKLCTQEIEKLIPLLYSKNMYIVISILLCVLFFFSCMIQQKHDEISSEELVPLVRKPVEKRKQKHDGMVKRVVLN